MIPNPNFGYPTLGSGGKNTVKRDLKIEQTHTQKDTGMDKFIERIGPEGQCVENSLFCYVNFHWLSG